MGLVRAHIGSSWIKKKKVTFISSSLSKEGVELLKKIADSSGKATMVHLPNPYRTGPNDPDYKVFCEYRTID